MQSSRSDRIHALPVQLANQIAAGEVVERPASVVKELVENSLDAGATRIDIDTRDGGKLLIRVQDNGRGIHADDFSLALTRHATSKLAELDDLYAISSLGFRGEALPSIASVCRFEMSSRYAGSKQAWSVQVDASGKHSGLQVHPQPEGTTITVEELFCNTPARRRFLRSARTEFLHIQDVVMRAALSRFDVAFSLRHNGKEVLRLPAVTGTEQHGRRLASIGGKAFMQALMPVNEQRDGVHVHGWLSPAASHRAQADRQFVFINGRMVRDKVLMHAIRQAYGEALPPGRYAMFVLYIDIDPARVDVNVHPTKHEVRFREVRPVHDVIFSSVQHALQQDMPVQQVSTQTQPLAAAGYVSAASSRPQATRETAEVYRFNRDTGQQGITVSSLLPGAYALVNEAGVCWLYSLNKVAVDVFKQHIDRQRSGQGIITRPLLIPQRLVLPVESADWADEVSTGLLEMGVELTRTGETSVLLRAMPACFEYVDAECFLERLLATRDVSQMQCIELAAGCLSKTMTTVEAQSLLAQLELQRHAACRRALGAEDMHKLFNRGETE